MNNKAEYRRRFSELDNLFDAETRAQLNSDMQRNLASITELAKARMVFCYVSNEREPSTRELINALIKHGRGVCVPRTEPGGVMEAVKITAFDDLRPGHYGIMEPPPDFAVVPKNEIDFAVIPGVAFDLAGNRLGKGAGYYDRWLADFTGTKCGLCTEMGLTGHLPVEPHDIKMDIIVTERRVLRGEDMTADLPDKSAQKEEPVEYERRPRKRMAVAKAFIYFLAVIGVSVALAAFGWLCADDVLALTAVEHTATVVVDKDDKVGDVAQKLADAEIIKQPWLFTMLGAFLDADEKIEPGTYELNSELDYVNLIKAMRQRSSYRATVKVSIPEGYTQEQLLQRLASEGVADYDALQEICSAYDFEYSFLEDIPLGAANRLEGFLFPDTYDFYVDEDPITVISKFLNNFAARYSAELRERTEEQEMSIYEVLIIASLIEKEAANTSEMSTVASVIFNRMASETLRKLSIDAALQYVLPERKLHLTYTELAIDSPYNTYMYEGLPPTPICNPGLNSIRAALYPKDTAFYFYALTDEGTHQFSKTAAEHQAVIDNNPETYGSD